MSIALIPSQSLTLGAKITRLFAPSTKVNEIINTVNQITAGTISITDVEVGNGTAALPSMTFASSLTNGIFLVGANDVGISTNGVLAFDVSASAATLASGIQLVSANATDASSSVTGSIKTAGGIGVAKSINVGTTVTAATSVLSPLLDTASAVPLVIGTTATTLTLTPATTVTGTLAASGAVTIGTNETYAKEVNHTVSVATSTTAAAVGGTLTVAAGTGATSGNGGPLVLNAGAGGATAASTGGQITITAGASGVGGGPSGAIVASTPNGTTSTGLISATSGNASAGTSGAVSLVTGSGTTATGAINITTGNASAGTAGNISLTAGTTSSATVSPIVIFNNNVVCGGLGAGTIAAGGTATGKQIVDGYLAVTGATGNLQLPTAAQIITALGFTPNAGTDLEFIINASGMTATNVVTLLVGANMVALKQVSAGDSATSQLLTVTQTAGVHIGVFKIVFDTTSSCIIGRVC